MKVYPYPSDNFLHGLIGATGKVQAILDGACEAGLYAAQLEGSRLGLLHLRQIQFEEVLRIVRHNRGWPLF